MGVEHAAAEAILGYVSVEELMEALNHEEVPLERVREPFCAGCKLQLLVWAALIGMYVCCARESVCVLECVSVSVSESECAALVFSGHPWVRLCEESMEALNHEEVPLMRI